MARRRSMTRNQNHDDEEASSSAKRPRSCAPWSELDHDLLYIVMMKLGVIEFLSFRGVCKSWRLLACSHEKKFMTSMPPMQMSISCGTREKTCHLEDFEGRKFMTILPSFFGGKCVGVTCGYLIFFEKSTRNFWLVNPITRKELHFPHFPFDYYPCTRGCRAILVFSPSLSGFVLVVLSAPRLGCPDKICCSIEGEGAWNHVSDHRQIIDLYVFKGKLYTLTARSLCKLRLGPQPKLMSLETKWPVIFYPDEFVSSRENLYVKSRTPQHRNSLLELDFGKMEWLKPCEKTFQEYAFFSCNWNRGVAVKRNSWADPRSHGRYADIYTNGKIRFYYTKMWYYPHECMNVDRID